ncbi:MAG: DUF4271 domain-containing protein [Rikenellaceae bacterium]
MIQKDTLYITDSLSCKYIIIDRYVSQKDTILSIDSLWDHHTLTRTASPSSFHQPNGFKNGNDILSSLILAFFILLVLFSREIINVFPAVMNSLLKLKNHFKLEDKLALSAQRNVVTVIAALYFPVLVTLMNRGYIIAKYQLLPNYFLLISLAVIFGFWLLRKGLYGILSWLTKDNITFKLIEKIGYNHLIISVIFSFPAILLRFIWPEISDTIILNVLIFSLLLVFIFYIIRGYQIIISHHYSHFFYILYLCGVELLPVALLSNFILSY